MKYSHFLALFIVSFACPDLSASDTERPKIMIFGDSICAGSNIPDGKPDDAWTSLVMAKGKLEIINKSRGGRPTDSIKEFNEALKTAGNINGIIISLGANDARDLSEQMVSRALSNIDTMITTAQASGIKKFIIVGPTNINKEALKQSYNIRNERTENLKKLNAAYEKYAHDKGFGFISLYGKVPEETMIVDGVHPDKAGNVIIADFMADRLFELLK